VLTFENQDDNSRCKGIEFTTNGVLLTRENGYVEYWNTDLVAQQAKLMQRMEGAAGIVASYHPLDPYCIIGST
jgi:hypothetical protein